MTLLVGDDYRLSDNELRLGEREARFRLLLIESIAVAIDLLTSFLFISRSGLKDDVREASTKLFTLGAQHGPKLSPELHHVGLLFRQKRVPLLHELLVRRLEWSDNLVVPLLGLLVELFPLAIFNQVIVEEAGFLSIALLALEVLLENRW
jgi:hypothetical protein